MGRMAIRMFAGVLLALVSYGGVLAAGAARAAQQPTSWLVKIGGESADHALQAQGFLPTTLTVNEGDTVNWAMNAAFVHTVTFLSGQPAPPEPIPSGEGDLLMLNPQAQFPYVCVIHAPQGMFGKVTVTAPTPASLPTTGAGGTGWPIALAGALALLLGLVVRRAAM